jgi:hypothetical protein
MIQIINNGDKTFDLFNDECNSRITNELYSSIVEDKNYFITEKNEKFGVVSKSGIIYLSCEYQSISICSNSDFIIYEKDNLFGILNTNGKGLNPICSSVFEVEHLNVDGSISFIIEIMYEYTIWNSLSGMHKELFLYLSCIGNGLMKFCKGNNRSKEDRLNQLVGLLDTKGNVLLEKKLTRIYSFTEINRIIIDDKDGCYIIDYQLKQISSGFSEIFGFFEGASIAVKNDQCGLIDIEGDWIDGYENLDYEQNESWWGYYYNPYDNGFVPIKRNGLFGMVNYNKKLFLDPISINEILFYRDGFIPITLRNGLTGIMDKEFNWVLTPSLLDFRFCFDSYNDVELYITLLGLPFIAKSPKTNKYGLVSYNGTWICEPKYDKIIANDFYNLPHKYLFYLKFEQDSFIGVINIHGKEIFKEKIDWRKSNDFDEFDIDLEDFRFDLECNYSKSKIPENHIYFLVVKNGEDGYYDAYGTFFLGNPIIDPI